MILRGKMDLHTRQMEKLLQHQIPNYIGENQSQETNCSISKNMVSLDLWFE